MNGYVIYEGPSLIDGEPIVAIVTGLGAKSQNSKTGDMPQVWVLRAGVDPCTAMREGTDASVCGDCPHRPRVTGPNALSYANRSCYVKIMPLNMVYKSYVAGKYARGLAAASVALAGRKVRLGAYGDPCAVPLDIWQNLLQCCSGSTGYTHQWRTCDTRYSEYLMASRDSELDVVVSRMHGYRPFYVDSSTTGTGPVRTVGTTKVASCPGSKEMSQVLTCAQCMMCDGTRTGKRSGVAVRLH